MRKISLIAIFLVFAFFGSFLYFSNDVFKISKLFVNYRVQIMFWEWGKTINGVSLIAEVQQVRLMDTLVQTLIVKKNVAKLMVKYKIFISKWLNLLIRCFMWKKSIKLLCSRLMCFSFLWWRLWLKNTYCELYFSLNIRWKLWI